MTRPVLLLLLALLCGASVRLSAAERLSPTLTLEADYWMPYNGDGQLQVGYALEVVRAVFARQGVRVEYQVTPWARAIADARDGKCDAVLGALGNEVAGFVLPSEEIGRSVQTFYVRQHARWRYHGIDSLRPITLGVIKDYSYFPALDRYLQTAHRGVFYGYGDQPLNHSLIPMLLRGRIDALVDDRAVVNYNLYQMGMSGQIQPAGSGNAPEKSYLAFSPINPQSAYYARVFSSGMAALRRSGELKKILGRYGLEDWK